MYYMYNGHGDTMYLLDNTGAIKNTYDYDIYGKEKTATEGGIANPVRYAGEYYDSESGLYYLRARYYDPDITRFITEDTYKGEYNDPLSLNLYTYCQGNPITRIDPSGHKDTDSGTGVTGYGGGGGAPTGGGYVDEKEDIYATKYRNGNSTSTRCGASTVPKYGNKLEYIFGNATGSKHNIDRSIVMERQLNSIGIFDNLNGRKMVLDNLTKAFNNPLSIFSVQENGRVIRESLLFGPNGSVKVQSVWEGAKLITVQLFGGK